MKLIFGIGAAALFLLFLAPGAVLGQNVVPNGDFELQDLGLWEMTGDNGWVKIKDYDVNGNGQITWCWKRKPGLNSGQPFGNGGLKQDVHLIAGVTYEFNADVAYLCTC